MTAMARVRRKNTKSRFSDSRRYDDRRHFDVTSDFHDFESRRHTRRLRDDDPSSIAMAPLSFEEAIREVLSASEPDKLPTYQPTRFVASTRVYAPPKATPKADLPRAQLASLKQIYSKFPERDKICIERQDRREALFATGKAGKGKRHGPGTYRRKESSNVSCRRK